MKKSIRSILSQSYVGKLFHLDKFLFFSIVCFFSLGLLANLIRLECSPFFLWNQYAEEYLPQSEYRISEVIFDKDSLNFKHVWLEARDILLSEPLANFLSVTVDHRPDFWSDYIETDWSPRHPAFQSMASKLVNRPAQYGAFPGWYKKYLSSVIHENIGNISVVRKTLVFETDGRLRENASDTVLVIR